MLNVQISNLTAEERDELEALGAVLFAARGLKNIQLTISSGVDPYETMVSGPTIEKMLESGLISVATPEELSAGTDTDRVVTPASIAAVPTPPVPVEDMNDQELSHLFGGNKPNVPTVPAVPTPPAPAADAPAVLNTGVDLDANGLPWDERIHASTRTKTANGQWKKKRGVEDFTVAHVESELRGVMNIPASPAVPTVPAVPTPPAPAVPTPPATPAIPAPPAPPALTQSAQAPSDFATFMQKYSPIIGTGKLTPADLQTAVQAAGLPNLGMLASRPDLIPTVAAQLDAKL